VPQVRRAVLDGKLGSGFGQLFEAEANPADLAWLTDPDRSAAPLYIRLPRGSLRVFFTNAILA
jgi:hypothetical protein